MLLVCDVGGGTTDLCVLRVTETGGVGALNLEQMDIVQGICPSSPPHLFNPSLTEI